MYCIGGSYALNHRAVRTMIHNALGCTIGCAVVNVMEEKKHLTKVDGESIEGRVHNTYIYWNVVGGR